MKRTLSVLLVMLLMMTLCSPALAADADAGPIGEISGQSYINETFGICASFPDGWKLLQYDEIAEEMGFPDTAASREGMAELLKESKQACDMYALSEDGDIGNVNIMLEDLGVLKELGEDSYCDAAAVQLEESFESMGVTLNSCTKETVDFAGKAHISILIESDWDGVRLYQRMVPIKSGQYMASVTASGVSLERADAILGLFESCGEEPEEVLGKVDSHHYSNLFLGIEADFDDGWYILSREETAETMGLAADLSSDEDVAELLRNSGTTIDLYAMSLNGNGDNVNLQLYNLLTSMGIGSLGLTEDEFYEAGMSDGIVEGLKSVGVENIQFDKQPYEFAGEEHVSVLVTGTFNGVPLYERMVLIKNGNYVATVTAFSYNEQNVDKILGFFAPYSFSLAEALAG